MADERILVVDDEVPITQLCARLLTEHGYLPVAANGGAEALELLSTQPFDLLLVDIQLPDTDGLTLLRRARELSPHLVAVVITGFATMERAIEALQAGARGFVLKPFEAAQLIGAIRQALEQRDREQEQLRLRVQLPLLEVVQAGLTGGDISMLAGRVVETAHRELACDQAVLFLLDEEADELASVPTGDGSAGAEVSLRRPAAGLLGRALQGDEVRVLDGSTAAEVVPALPGTGAAAGQAVLVPLHTGIRPVGLLFLRWVSGRAPLNAGDLGMLVVVGRHVATLLENVRLRIETERRARELTALYNAGRALISTLDLQAVLQTITGEVTGMLDVEWGSVLLYEPADDRLLIAAAVHDQGQAPTGQYLPASEGVAGWALRERRTAVVEDTQRDPRFYDKIDRATGLTTRSIVAVPLISKDKVLGVVEALNKRSGPFSKHDAELLEALAGSAAIAIDNARLYEALSRGKREWERTFDTIADGICILNTEWQIVRVNRALANLLGTTPQALIGRRCYELFCHLDHPPTNCPCQEAWTSGQVVEFECEKSRPAGTFRERAYPVREGDDVHALVLVLQDITERKRIEAELLRVGKLAAVGEAAATIVHEVRNVLSGIASGLDYIKGSTPPNGGGLEAIAVIEDELQRAFGILEDIRLVTRPLQLDRQPCSLADVLQRVLARSMSQLAAKEIHLTGSYVEGIPPLWLDVPRIEQALINLLRNAWEASEPGETIEVAARFQQAGTPEVVVAISDNGPGIPPEIQDHLLEPFATTKGGGLGLGLSVAHRLIAAHGGSLELHGGAAGGTTALVRLPLGASVSADPERRPT